MPLNVRRFGAAWFLVFLCVFAVLAQSPTSADVMRARVAKAKAYVAVKNYGAAIYELEGIKREINEPSVNGVVQVMLMNCYLEQADYKRAQTLLNELFSAQKSGKPNVNYFAAAGQVVRSARAQLDRYKSLGLSVADATLPAEAANDVNKMRETVELVVAQSKTLGENKKQTSDAMTLLEEATGARGALARDDYDARRWKNEVADARESLVSSRSTIINASDEPLPTAQVPNNSVASLSPVNPNSNQTTPSIPPLSGRQNASTAQNIQPINKTETPKTEILETNNAAEKTALQPNATPDARKVEPQNTAAQNVQTQSTSAQNTNTPNNPSRSRTVETRGAERASDNLNNSTANPTETAKDAAPIVVGSLIEYATQKVNPTYPPAARSIRMTGVVRVELTVDEEGAVDVKNTSGPAMLQRAAVDAVKRWKFKPFMRDGQPVKATGFVSFNFNL